MMGLADAAAWLVTLSHIGPVALAVTSSLTISFLAKPGQADLLAHATLLRLGRRQSVSEVRLWSDGTDPSTPVAHATVTYAIPSSGAAETRPVGIGEASGASAGALRERVLELLAGPDGTNGGSRAASRATSTEVVQDRPGRHERRERRGLRKGENELHDSPAWSSRSIT